MYCSNLLLQKDMSWVGVLKLLRRAAGVFLGMYKTEWQWQLACGQVSSVAWYSACLFKLSQPKKHLLKL